MVKLMAFGDRRTPLRVDKEKLQAWQDRSRKPIDRKPMVTKPSKRKRAATAALTAVTPELYERSAGWCEAQIPDVCEGRGTNRHHRLGEGQGGPSTLVNLMHVCGMGNATGCHGFISTHRDDAKKNGWIIEMGGDPESTPWLRRGIWFL